MAVRYELAVGLNKGFKTTKIRRVTYKGNKKIKGLKGTNVKNVSYFQKKNSLEVGSVFLVLSWVKCMCENA